MKDEILYKVVSVDSDFIKNYPDKITTILNNEHSGNTYGYYDFKNHRYLVTYISDNFNINDELYERDKEIEKLQEIIIKAKDYIANNEELTVNDRLDYLLFIRSILSSYKNYENCKRILQLDYEENHKWEDKIK